MKNLILTGLLFATAISLSFAQLKVVAPDGDVNIGDVSGITRDGKLKVQGVIVAETSVAVGNQIASFTVAGQQTTFAHNGTGKFLLRNFKSGAEIQILGKKGSANATALMMKSNGNIGLGIAAPLANLHIKGNNAMKTSGGMWIGSSDKRLKKDINPYTQGLNAVLNLNPVSFSYNGKAGIEDTQTKHIGLIAQEYQKIAPDAVKKYVYRDSEEIEEEGGNLSYKYGSEEEYLSIDPTPVMYMLVNAIKEQQQIITELQEEVKSIKATGFTPSNINSTNVLIQGSADKVMLSQNKPNPFASNTQIEYFVPESATNAVMSFTDISGKEIKRLPLNAGVGNLEVSIKEMPIGIYSYSLIVDGSTIATKKMVLSR